MIHSALRALLPDPNWSRNSGIGLKRSQTLFSQSEAILTAAAQAAWIGLRYQVPIIATTIEVGEDDVPMLKYRVPRINEVEEWAHRTLVVHHRPALDINRLREELGELKVPSPQGDQTWMHLVLDSSKDTASVSRIGFIFHTHHSVTDGNGGKIITNRYLAEFGTRLRAGNTSIPDFLWGTESENLTPAIFNVLGPSEPVPIHPSSDQEPTFAHPFYRTLGGEMQSIGASMENQYGFKARDGDQGWPDSRRAELVFSPKESKTLLTYMKNEPYTLAVLLHAALAMVVMFYKPGSKDAKNSFLNNFVMVDVRSHLKVPYTGEGYPGYAIAPPMLRLPVSLFLTSEGTALALDKELLVKVMSEIRERYAEHKERAISYIAPASDIFAYAMKRSYAVDHHPVNQCYMFSSDGPGEKFLKSTVRDTSGNTLFEITKFFTFICHPTLRLISVCRLGRELWKLARILTGTCWLRRT
ncbi:hypothetical protein B0H16DRAFT_1572945 [Mycena metata]|uniref:PID domain-containing protein n=1 Tax=Mycena metata TaxID=1033252 RepID=A0AAD7MXH8_9AGAR|nr:hypothetical protein B0H16DRAFT_1572945 [Mycena metata]